MAKMIAAETVRTIVLTNIEAIKEMILEGAPTPELAERITDGIYDGTLSNGSDSDMFSFMELGVDKETFLISMLGKTEAIKKTILGTPELRAVWARKEIITLRNKKQSERYVKSNLANGISFGANKRNNENEAKRLDAVYFPTTQEELEVNGEAIHREVGLGHSMNNIYGIFKRLSQSGHTTDQIADLFQLDKEFVESTLGDNSEIGEMLKLSKALLVSELSERLIKSAMGGVIREHHYKYDSKDDLVGEARLDKVVVKDKPGDPISIMKILEKIKPDFWKDEQKTMSIEGTGVLLVKEAPSDPKDWSNMAKNQQKQLQNKVEDDRK